MDITSVEALKSQLETRYSGLRAEQDKDWKFYTDTFDVPQIDTNFQHVQRTGRGKRMVDRPSEHIITSNPQVFVSHKLKTKLESAKKIAEIFNTLWFPYIKYQNPNPVKESVKKVLLRGETYLQVIHNDDWVISAKNNEGKEIKGEDGKPMFLKRGLPVHFLVPDSYNISVVEDKFGNIQKLIVSHPRQAWQVKAMFPDWTTDTNDPAVEWLECWDEGERYFEAAGKQVLHEKNLYGVVPFARVLSGFGTESSAGKLEDLIVGRLRDERDTLTRQCAMTTDFDSIFHQFANHNITVQPDGKILEAVPKDFQRNYTRKKGHINELPAGLIVEHDVETLPKDSDYQYLYSINNDLDRSDPLVMAGFPAGSSGRQDDLASVNAMRRYETVVENIEHLWAQGFKLALTVMDKIPTLRDAAGISKKDMDDDYQVDVQLRAPDPLEADRKITLGFKLWAQGNGSISLERLHTQFQGMTQAESDNEIAKMLADKVTLYNPDVAEAMGIEFAEATGMQKWLDMVKQRRMQTQTQGQALQKQPTPSQQQRTAGEVETPLGNEMIDMAFGSKGIRNSQQ